VNLKIKTLLMTLLLLLSGFATSFLFINPTQASTTTYDWLDIWQPSLSWGNNQDHLAINSTGSVFIGGGSQTQYHYLAIYDPNSGTRVWNDTIKFDDANFAFKGLAVNGTDIYATVENGSGTVSTFYCKYNVTKSQEWNQTWANGSRPTMPRDIVLDASNVYVVGEGFQIGFLAKFETTGNKLWNVSVAGAGQVDGAVVNGSSIYMVGRDTQGSPDAFLAKHSTTNGAQDWIVSFGTPGAYDGSRDVACDNSGNVYVTGYFQNPGYQAFLAKFNSTGHEQWIVNYTVQASGGDKIAIDLNNNYIYIAGWIGVDNMDYPTHKALQLKYDTNGNLVRADTWVQEANHWTNAYSIAIDAAGNVFLVGQTNDSNGIYKTFIIKNLGQPTGNNGLTLDEIIATIIITVLVIAIPAGGIIGLAVIVGRKQT